MPGRVFFYIVQEYSRSFILHTSINHRLLTSNQSYLLLVFVLVSAIYNSFSGMSLSNLEDFGNQSQQPVHMSHHVDESSGKNRLESCGDHHSFCETSQTSMDCSDSSHCNPGIGILPLQYTSTLLLSHPLVASLVVQYRSSELTPPYIPPINTP